ncbi:MAG: long-chain fatty acid--CoA ligase [Deltaproteobacteria bacterium]|nr:MAG: long-chain fatty acid--CoA ligase [Deltaproteobacteria bacterium]
MKSHASLPAMFFDAARASLGQTRYLRKVEGRYVPTDWDTCLARVEAIAAGLLECGVAAGDRVAILAHTRPEWMEVDLAALAVGCVTVPIYPSNLPVECGFILADSGARIVFVEDPDQAEKIAAVEATGGEVDGRRFQVDVDRLFLFEGDHARGEPLEQLIERGRSALDARRGEIEQRTAALSRDDLATIVYTSGTTGVPKGVMQTHGNHLATLEAVERIGIVRRGEIDFAFLPLAHSFGRMMEYVGIYLGTITAYAEKIETIADDMAAVRPHFLPSVPRIYEKVHAAVYRARGESSPLARWIFDRALEIGNRRADYVNRGQRVPLVLGALDALAHRLVFSKIQARVGGRIRYFISGGAPLAPEINRFFHAVGMPVLEGYGLTETTPILTCNMPGRTRIGTVGVPLHGVTVKIAEDGEILAKGPNVAIGYYQRPEETAAAWDDDGWFRTGDIGEIDGEGFLRITDRKKELIKTAGGKYVAPQKIENMLKARPLISQAVVIGDRLKYCVALITLDEEAVRAWAKGQGVDVSSAGSLASDERVLAEVGRQVDAVNAELASYESIKYFRVLPRDFSIETGELTPSLKIKRKVVAERYADTIASMYQS